MKQAIVTDKYGPRGAVIVHDDEILQFEGDLACRLIERWGVVAAAPDGEDAAGRQKIRLGTPEEVVDRACACAALMTEQLRLRGWLSKGPSLEEYIGFADDDEKSGRK